MGRNRGLVMNMAPRRQAPRWPFSNRPSFVTAGLVPAERCSQPDAAPNRHSTRSPHAARGGVGRAATHGFGLEKTALPSPQPTEAGTEVA